MRALLALPLLLPTPLLAQSEEEIGVGVELILAVDVSRSMDPDEQTIQREGYARALRSPQVQDAILGGGYGRVALTYVEWAGAKSQTVLIPWTLIDSSEAAAAFAAEIEAGRLRSASRTSIAGAIDYAVPLFEDNGYQGMRRVIDISGDGPNNAGRSVTTARDAALNLGITINGLPLMTNSATNSLYGARGTIANLDLYYTDCVIGGPGAFTIPVTNWDQFAASIQQKLIMELAGTQPPAALFRVQAETPSDCLIGERMWMQRTNGDSLP